MKRILLISDTHRHIDDRILLHAENTDEIWHAGDIGDIKVTDKLNEIAPVRAVYGNIDGTEIRLTYPKWQHFELEKVKVSMIHIGGYPYRYAQGVKSVLLKEKPKIFISGHSHILKVMPDKSLNLIHMNPGAAGYQGFHKIRTMLKFELEEGEIKNLNVIELGTRD